MHGIRCDEVKFQNSSSLDYSKYILVHTGVYRKYRYILQQTSTLHLIALHPSFTPTSLCRTLGLVFFYRFFLIANSRRGLLRPKFHCHVLTSYTLLPRLPSEAVESAQPKGKTEPLWLLNLCGIVGVELQARNKGWGGLCPSLPYGQLEPHEGTVLGQAHTVWALSASSIGPLIGNKVQLLKCHCAEKD